MQFAGVEIYPCLSGALYMPAHDVLLVADLHLEKGSSRAHKGILLPPYDTRTGLLMLEAAISKWTPKQVILLGDSFHDLAGPERMVAKDRTLLEKMAATTGFVWLSGNHDPILPLNIPGEHAAMLMLGKATLRHEPQPGAHHEIAGHLHPVAAVRQRGRRIRTKCFLISTSRIILPAFGAYTGGLDVSHPAFRPLFASDAFRAIMIGRSALHILPGCVVLGR